MKSVLNKVKKNECVIRALVEATGASHDKAHSFIEDLIIEGKKHLRMTEVSKHFGVNAFEIGEEQADGTKKLVQRYRMNKKWKEGGYTIVSFAKKFKKGSYIIFVRDTAYAIVDGIIKGAEEMSSNRSRVLQAFKVE